MTQTQFDRRTTEENSYGESGSQQPAATPTSGSDLSQYPFNPATGERNPNYVGQAQGSQSVSETGKSSVGSGEAVKVRQIPKLLNDFPILEADGQELLQRHRLNRIPAKSGLERQLVEKHDGLMGYYQFMAKINPTSATFDPPPYNEIPAPRGGLDTLTQNLLGPRPVLTEDMFGKERQGVVDQQLQYDTDFTNMRRLLFTLNADRLRYENRYTMSAPLRVPSEMVDDSRFA